MGRNRRVRRGEIYFVLIVLLVFAGIAGLLIYGIATKGNSPYRVTVYSDGEAVREYLSVERPIGAHSGVAFRESGTDRIVEVSGTFVVEQIKPQSAVGNSNEPASE